MPDTTLIVSLAGICVSGVVGPAATGWATRRATTQQFKRELARQRREDLASLVDEAATLLAHGATYVRLIESAKSAGRPVPAEIQDWLGAVFPMEQRLRLRLPPEDPIVSSYRAVREQLLDLQDHKIGTSGYERAVGAFENARDRFLEIARTALSELPKGE